MLRISYNIFFIPSVVPQLVALHFLSFYLLDLTVVNMYRLYLHCLGNVCRDCAQQTFIIHLQFKMGLCEAFLEGWESQDVNLQNLVPLSL